MRIDPDRADLALADAHYGLLCVIANREATARGRDFDDIVAWGWFGLLHAVELWDASRGLQFSTFATPRIRGAILDGLRREDPAPRKYRERQRAGCQQTNAAWKQRRWDAMHAMLTALPLDQSFIENGQHVRAEMVALDVEASGLDDDELALLHAAMAALTETERRVVLASYYDDRTLASIAADLGVSDSRVSQIRTSALAKLRAQLPALAPDTRSRA